MNAYDNILHLCLFVCVCASVHVCECECSPAFFRVFVPSKDANRATRRTQHITLTNYDDCMGVDLSYVCVSTGQCVRTCLCMWLPLCVGEGGHERVTAHMRTRVHAHRRTPIRRGSPAGCSSRCASSRCGSRASRVVGRSRLSARLSSRASRGSRPCRHSLAMAVHAYGVATKFSDFILEPLDIQRFRLPLEFWPWSKTVRFAAGTTVLHGSNQMTFLWYHADVWPRSFTFPAHFFLSSISSGGNAAL